MTLHSNNEILDGYKENNNLNDFDLIHIYPKELTRGKGFVNSRFFEVVGYNRDTKERKYLGKHDSVYPMIDVIPVKGIEVFEDKSVIVVFSHLMDISIYTTTTMYIQERSKS